MHGCEPGLVYLALREKGFIPDQDTVVVLGDIVDRGIVLTGGGAMMDGVIDLAQKVFHTTSVRLGVPESLGGIEEDYRRPDFATVIGLVLANKSLASGKDRSRRAKVRPGKKEKQKDESVLKKIFKSLF